MKTAGPVIVSVVLVAAIAFAVGSGFMDAGTVVLVFILGVIAVPIASRLGTEVDHWMWWVGPAAYLAKLIGSSGLEASVSTGRGRSTISRRRSPCCARASRASGSAACESGHRRRTRSASGSAPTGRG